MFEKATRLKLRFNTPVGNVSIEDLWDMPLTAPNGVDLDNMAKGLSKAVAESKDESFVVKKSATNTVLGLKFDIVKYVIKVKLEEIEASEKRAETKAKKEKILEIIADKEDTSLRNKSAASLKKMLEDL